MTISSTRSVPHKWLLVALLACVLPGIAALPGLAEDWQVQLERLRVVEKQEQSGDDPYFLVIAFRSRFGTPNSTKTWSTDISVIGRNLKKGNECKIPASVGRVSFGNVAKLPAKDLLKGKMPEVLGVVFVPMEHDDTPKKIILSIRDELRKAIGNEVSELVEKGKPRTSSQKEFAEDIRQFVSRAKVCIKNATLKGVLQKIRFQDDKDDLIDVKTLLFIAAEPSAQLKLPVDPAIFAGPLSPVRRQIGRDPLVFRGDGAIYHVTVSLQRVIVNTKFRSQHNLGEIPCLSHN